MRLAVKGSFCGVAGVASLVIFLPGLVGAPRQMRRLALDAPPGARFEFAGWVGGRIDRNIDRWILSAPVANPGMLGMFRMRDRKPEPQIVPWAGEFAGKYLISAVEALRMTGRPDVGKFVGKFVDDLISTQADDGYLGPFPRRERLLGHWDLWGHYHVMEGLLLWAERAGAGRDSRDKALAAARRAADLITRTYLDTGKRVFDAGSHEMNMAVIHVLGKLYRQSGEARYLRMMREIEKDWERAGDYFRTGLAGVDFYRTPRPRWESLHDIQGLVELYRITGDERYRTAFVNTWKSIARRDRHNTGGFTTGERAVGNPYTPGAIETCCTIAWMALSVDMLRLTGDPEAADELELSTFNGMLGAQHPSGGWWTYSTPMDGQREASAHAIVFQARAGTPELNCCSVNGPRGLGMLSEWAVLADSEGVVLNYFGPVKVSIRLRDGTALRLEEETRYPAGDGAISIAVHTERDAELTLKLRIPAWSRKTSVAFPGAPADLRPSPGTYLAIRRRWRGGDRVRLGLDMRLRAWSGDRHQRRKVSLYRGPILLAYDQRWNAFDEAALKPVDVAALAGTRVTPQDAAPGLLAPCLLVRVPMVGGGSLALCDFATAGATGTRYRSWLPAVNAPPPPLLEKEGAARETRAPEANSDGVLVAAGLRGGAKPSYGLLLDARGTKAAAGGKSLLFNGKDGIVRYAVPWFPEKDYSVVVRVAPEELPEGRIAQVFSAWAASMDDPLRITVDGGRLFARIEAQQGYSTQGVAITPGKWIHVAAVKAGTRLCLYVDGKARSSTKVPAEVWSQAANVGLGGNPNYSGNEFLAAAMADFALYARALSAEEVAALAR